MLVRVPSREAHGADGFLKEVFTSDVVLMRLVQHPVVPLKSFCSLRSNSSQCVSCRNWVSPFAGQASYFSVALAGGI